MFKVGTHITLKLEDDKTCIYIKGELFRQCKKLVINIPTRDVDRVSDFETIDEIAGATKDDSVSFNISPELEFWGHCSNLQAWFENGYDTKLLHSSLAFPLLSELFKVGDLLARKVYKEEISKRLGSGNNTVMLLILKSHYLDDFSHEELITIYNENLSHFAASELFLLFLYNYYLFKIPVISKRCKDAINDIFFSGDFGVKKEILKNYIEIWSKDELLKLFKELRSLSNGDLSDRLEALGMLFFELEFNYDFKLSNSEVITTLLVEGEQKLILDTFNSSKYPYIKANFEDDNVRRRLWEKELYYDFFKGHLNSIELMYSYSNSTEFYNNLQKLRNLRELRNLNIINLNGFDIDYNYIKSVLNGTSIETVKVYKRSKYSQTRLQKFLLFG